MYGQLNVVMRLGDLFFRLCDIPICEVFLGGLRCVESFLQLVVMMMVGRGRG